MGVSRPRLQVLHEVPVLGARVLVLVVARPPVGRDAVHPEGVAHPAAGVDHSHSSPAGIAAVFVLVQALIKWWKNPLIISSATRSEKVCAYRHDVYLVPLAVDGRPLRVTDGGDGGLVVAARGDDLDLVGVDGVGEEVVQVVVAPTLPAKDEQLAKTL